MKYRIERKGRYYVLYENNKPVGRYSTMRGAETAMTIRYNRSI